MTGRAFNLLKDGRIRAESAEHAEGVLASLSKNLSIL
jgi:hypothetical protein